MSKGIPGGIGRYQRRVKRVVRPLLKTLWRVRVEGLDRVPAEGPAVLCPNHLAAIDSFFLPVALDRDVIFVGKSEYLDDWKTSRLFPALGMIPIDRRGGDHATAALDAARTVLKGGGLFAIYPEGTRSRTGRLHRGHIGAARLAVETGARIIPVGLVGTAAIQPINSTLPRPLLQVTIRFGEPITVDRYRSRLGDHTVYRQLIDEVMFEIRQLTGQEYDSHYVGAAHGADKVAGAGSEAAGSAVAPRSSAEVLVSRPLETATG